MPLRPTSLAKARVKPSRPALEAEYAASPPRSIMMIERESDKAWYRMARSVEADSKIRGLVAFSWFHSPDTFKVSPHLSFINKPFVESGAVITTLLSG